MFGNNRILGSPSVASATISGGLKDGARGPIVNMPMSSGSQYTSHQSPLGVAVSGRHGGLSPTITCSSGPPITGSSIPVSSAAVVGLPTSVLPGYLLTHPPTTSISTKAVVGGSPTCGVGDGRNPSAGTSAQHQQYYKSVPATLSPASRHTTFQDRSHTTNTSNTVMTATINNSASLGTAVTSGRVASSTMDNTSGSNNTHPGGAAVDPQQQQQVLTLVRGRAGGDGETRQLLSILMQEKVNPSTHTKEIYIQLTDKSDPFLFYSLRLTEDDFQQLKASQGLLVDFSSFPGMLRQLLDKCREESGNTTGNPSFILVMNHSSTGTTLEFTELNMFKHLCHLSLIIVKATTDQLKDYLVTCIKQLQAQLGSSTAQLSLGEQQLAEQQRQLDQWAAEVAAVRRQQQETSSSLEHKLLADVQAEREKFNKKITDLQNRFELERRETESRHTRSLEQLENRVASLDVQNRDLLEGKYRSESSMRELRSKLSCKEEEVVRLQADLNAVARDKGVSEARTRDEFCRAQELEKRLLALEEQLRQRDRDLHRSRELAKQVDAEKETLSQELKDKLGVVQRRETAVRGVADELIKANEIIRKLQDSLKQEQNKSKLRGRIAAEQEKLLGDKDVELGQAREELLTATQTTQDKDKLLAEARQRCTEQEEKVDSLEKTNRSNENVINWLNKQLSSYKSTETAVATSRGSGSSRATGRGGLSRRSTSDVNTGPTKENLPLVGLDPKYFEHSTPGGSMTRSEIPDVTKLPTNIKRGGLLRR